MLTMVDIGQEWFIMGDNQQANNRWACFWWEWFDTNCQLVELLGQGSERQLILGKQAVEQICSADVGRMWVAVHSSARFHPRLNDSFGGVD